MELNQYYVLVRDIVVRKVLQRPKILVRVLHVALWFFFFHFSSVVLLGFCRKVVVWIKSTSLPCLPQSREPVCIHEYVEWRRQKVWADEGDKGGTSLCVVRIPSVFFFFFIFILLLFLWWTYIYFFFFFVVVWLIVVWCIRPGVRCEKYGVYLNTAGYFTPLRSVRSGGAGRGSCRCLGGRWASFWRCHHERVRPWSSHEGSKRMTWLAMWC